jgi:hypothetical protein
VATTDFELLDLHRPVLKYDSNECYFADAADEWTDHQGNRLKKGDRVLAEAGGGTVAELSIDFLGTCEYPGGEEVAAGDLIDCADDDYRADAAMMHRQAKYGNKMYGRAVREPGGGALWLQYWFFYFYNDFNLIGSLIKAGLHEGDWEMIQIRLDDDGAPELAVYAQHRHAGVRSWDEVERDGDRPVIYVARGSHASYFDQGHHFTGVWWDHADGARETPELELLQIRAEADDWKWIHWPGRWGGTTGGRLPMDDSSPVGPIMHGQWHDPAALLPKAAERMSLAAAAEAPPPPPPALDSVTVEAAPGGLAIGYEVKPAEDAELLGLVVTINSAEEPGVPPKTQTVPISDLSGTVQIPAAIDRSKPYDIAVSAAFAPFLATDAVRVDLPPAAAQAPTPPTPAVPGS